MGDSWADEYAKSYGWNDSEKTIPEGPVSKPIYARKLKRFDTSLQKKYRLCQKEMEKEHIQNGPDFVRWMSKKFDPQNEHHILLAQEIASCLWLRYHLAPVGVHPV